jgi:hypothetical protein
MLIAFFVTLFALDLPAEFRAGAAWRTVTPDPLLPVSGGAGPSHAASKKIGELTVRALVLENEGTRVAIVGGDFLGFPAVLGDRVRARVPEIPAENILIGATHTHSAPDCYGFPEENGPSKADLKYLESVCVRMTEAIQEATRVLRPASLKISSGKAAGRIAYNYYAEQLYDPRCNVIQAQDLEGRPLATLVNYAIHPEVLGPEQGVVSPDLVGPLYERIQERGGGMGIFMNSAQGGMVTADCRGPDGKDIQTWGECERIGKLLADEALRIVSAATVEVNPSLFCAAKRIEFPVDSAPLRQVLKTSPLRYPGTEDGKVSTQVNVVNVGSAQILTIPGEALPNIGYYLKRKMHGKDNFLFGLTNDAFGYILTKVDWNSFERYSYVSRICLGEMTGEIYLNTVLPWIDGLPRPGR